MLTGFFSILLHVFVQIDAEKHTDEAEKVNFQFKAQGELEQNQVDGERGVDSGRKIGGKDRLNCALRGHDPEDFSQHSSQESTDENENEQNPV